jgi:Ca2+/Na+ antiporter
MDLTSLGINVPLDLTSFGINTLLIVGIVALTEALKKLDTNNKFKNYYILIPLILGVVSSFLVTKPLVVTEIVTNAIIYAGVSGYVYKSGKLALTKNKEGKVDGK